MITIENMTQHQIYFNVNDEFKCLDLFLNKSRDSQTFYLYAELKSLL